MPSQLFEITSNYSRITFDDKMLATKLQLTRFMYITASASNRFMIVKLSGWTKGHKYISNGVKTSYSACFNLPATTLADQSFYQSDPRFFDVIHNEPVDISSHVLECYINNSATNNDISPSNPVYIEFTYE